MTAARFLIVNADDFGLSPGVNRGVIEAHERGVVTSASLMVRGEAAAPAASYARSRPVLSVGLHVDLGEWEHLEGGWAPLYEVVAADDPAAVAEEVGRQLAAFRRLVGSDPTHLDSHQHAHRKEPARGVVYEIGRRLGVPVRHFSPRVRYCGGFYGQTADGEPLPEAIAVEGLIRTLTGLSPGATELACHPGYAEGLCTMYGAERAREVATLCDPAVRRFLEREGILLCSFLGLPGGT